MILPRRVPVHRAFAAPLAAPEVGGRLSELCFEIITAPPEAFAGHLAGQAGTPGRAAREAGLRHERG